MTCTCHVLTADSQRLLVAARTSTAVLDRTLKTAADTVGGAALDLVARFKNSPNRAFHNVVVSELRQKERFCAGPLRPLESGGAGHPPVARDTFPCWLWWRRLLWLQ